MLSLIYYITFFGGSAELRLAEWLSRPLYIHELFLKEGSQPRTRLLYPSQTNHFHSLPNLAGRNKDFSVIVHIYIYIYNGARIYIYTDNDDSNTDEWMNMVLLCGSFAQSVIVYIDVVLRFRAQLTDRLLRRTSEAVRCDSDRTWGDRERERERESERERERKREREREREQQKHVFIMRISKTFIVVSLVCFFVYSH